MSIVNTFNRVLKNSPFLLFSAPSTMFRLYFRPFAFDLFRSTHSIFLRRLLNCPFAHPGSARSRDILNKLYAPPTRYTQNCVRAIPIKRVFRNSATVLSHPKICSTSFRFC